MVGFALDALKEGFFGEQANRLVLIEYQALARAPRATLQHLYTLLDEPSFEHDFDNVEYEADELDLALGTRGLHTVRRKVEWIDRQSVLPPELFARFANDTLLRDSVTALIAEGVVSLDEIVVDGMKIRASAGRGSFKTRKTLEKVSAAVARRLAALKAEVAGVGGAASSRRRQAAGRRGHAKRLKTHAVDEKKKSEPSASLTDPEARRMRFSDGAVRAGYNARIAADAKAGIIVAIEMTDRHNDAGLAGPSLPLRRRVGDLVRRYGVPPNAMLVRGLRKVQAVARWHALAHNLIAAHRLRVAAA